MRKEITDDLDALLDVLLPDLAKSLREANQSADLLEIILDLGRLPEARFLSRELVLSGTEVGPQDIDYVVSRIGDFGDDNRAGIERTLHRISALRNRKGRIVGLTLRVGRAVYGTIDIIQDLVDSGQSILLLGRPGIGKTTMLREAARILADKHRVVIVDTSNEIGGDGDIPHPAIGRSRRMQVVTPTMQHAVMIEAVENHMPEVIVIDEIGTELEAAAARTIAERGVQLIGTAHGNTLDNLMLNPTLSDLVGGIQSVTLGDEEARRRGTQKSILERKAPPTFDVVIEIQDWDRVVVRHNVAEAVDALLRGRPITPELRYRDAAGSIHKEQPTPEAPQREEGRWPQSQAMSPWPAMSPRAASAPRGSSFASGSAAALQPQPAQVQPVTMNPKEALKVFSYGINQNRLRQAARELGVPLEIINELGKADVVFTLRTHYRKRPAALSEAERQGLPVYVLRSNTVVQMQRFLAELFGLQPAEDPFSVAMRETELAINKLLAGAEYVDLSPQNAYIRRKQHELARQSNLLSRSAGKDPYRHVQIYQDPRVAS